MEIEKDWFIDCYKLSSIFIGNFFCQFLQVKDWHDLCLCIYGIELDFCPRDNAIKEMQDAIDCAGMNGQVKLF